MTWLFYIYRDARVGGSLVALHVGRTLDTFTYSELSTLVLSKGPIRTDEICVHVPRAASHRRILPTTRTRLMTPVTQCDHCAAVHSSRPARSHCQMATENDAYNAHIFLGRRGLRWKGHSDLAWVSVASVADLYIALLSVDSYLYYNIQIKNPDIDLFTTRVRLRKQRSTIADGCGCIHRNTSVSVASPSLYCS